MTTIAIDSQESTGHHNNHHAFRADQLFAPFLLVKSDQIGLLCSLCNQTVVNLSFDASHHSKQSSKTNSSIESIVLNNYDWLERSQVILCNHSTVHRFHFQVFDSVTNNAEDSFIRNNDEVTVNLDKNEQTDQSGTMISEDPKLVHHHHHHYHLPGASGHHHQRHHYVAPPRYYNNAISPLQVINVAHGTSMARHVDVNIDEAASKLNPIVPIKRPNSVNSSGSGSSESDAGGGVASSTQSSDQGPSSIISESSSSDDYEYGPGIVDRLKHKFMALATEKVDSKKLTMKRFNSMEELTYKASYGSGLSMNTPPTAANGHLNGLKSNTKLVTTSYNQHKLVNGTKKRIIQFMSNKENHETVKSSHGTFIKATSASPPLSKITSSVADAPPAPLYPTNIVKQFIKNQHAKLTMPATTAPPPPPPLPQSETSAVNQKKMVLAPMPYIKRSKSVDTLTLMHQNGLSHNAHWEPKTNGSDESKPPLDDVPPLPPPPPALHCCSQREHHEDNVEHRPHLGADNVLCGNHFGDVEQQEQHVDSVEEEEEEELTVSIAPSSTSASGGQSDTDSLLLSSMSSTSTNATVIATTNKQPPPPPSTVMVEQDKHSDKVIIQPNHHNNKSIDKGTVLKTCTESVRANVDDHSALSSSSSSLVPNASTTILANDCTRTTLLLNNHRNCDNSMVNGNALSDHHVPLESSTPTQSTLITEKEDNLKHDSNVIHYNLVNHDDDDSSTSTLTKPNPNANNTSINSVTASDKMIISSSDTLARPTLGPQSCVTTVKSSELPAQDIVKKYKQLFEVNKPKVPSRVTSHGTASHFKSLPTSTLPSSHQSSKLNGTLGRAAPPKPAFKPHTTGRTFPTKPVVAVHSKPVPGKPLPPPPPSSIATKVATKPLAPAIPNRSTLGVKKVSSSTLNTAKPVGASNSSKPPPLPKRNPPGKVDVAKVNERKGDHHQQQGEHYGKTIVLSVSQLGLIIDTVWLTIK